MISISSLLQWQQPLWLLVIIVPGVLYWWTLRRPTRLRLDTFADAHLLPRLITGKKSGQSWGKSFLVAWALSALAAAGPYMSSDQASPTQRAAMDIAVVVDISPSMAVQDMAPSRLGRAKTELKAFAQRLTQSRVALITFSANAYTVLPLTTDIDTFHYFVEQLDPNLASLQGSNVAKALDLAGAALQQSDTHSRAIILITDGETHDLGAMAAAMRLRDNDVPLLILGVGTPTGGPIPDDAGRFTRYRGDIVISQANPAMNDRLARAANGLYIPVRDDGSDWDMIFNRLNDIHPNSAYVINERNNIKLWPWLLALSLMLFLWSARRSSAMVFCILLFLNTIPSAPLLAAPWDEQQAREALLAGNYKQASAIYTSLRHSFTRSMGLGVITYRQTAWSDALTHFQQAALLATTREEQALASYNKGNALAKLDRLQEAQAAYRYALSLRPNFPRAALNLSLITKALHLATNTQKKAPSLKEQQARRGELKNGEQASTSTSQTRTMSRHQTDTATTTASQPTPKVLPGTPQDPSTLLRKRFSREDRDARQIIVVDKPW